MTHASAPAILDPLRRASRLIALLVLLGASPMMLTGCYGRFPLTRAVYQLNGDISEDKWVRSIVFWVFVIVPVYWVASLGDAIVLNLIEFWTGETIEVGSVPGPDGTTVTLAPGENAGEAILSVSKDGVTLSSQKFVKVSDTTFEVLDRDGRLAGKVIKNGGGFDLTDASGRTIQSLGATEIASALSAR